MSQVRNKKRDEKKKQAGGDAVLMPEVFVSNFNKQQKNFVKYKRQKTSHKDHAQVVDKQQLSVAKDQRVQIDSLVLVLRIKESRNATPQA